MYQINVHRKYNQVSRTEPFFYCINNRFTITTDNMIYKTINREGMPQDGKWIFMKKIF